MLTLSVVMMLVSASASTQPREARGVRAARLMTEVELNEISDIDRQVRELQRGAGSSALLVSSIGVLAVGLVVPVVAGAVALVGSFFLGFFGLIVAAAGSTSLLELIPPLWALVFGWIPVWGWVAIGACAVAGGGMLLAAIVSDAPRQAEAAALKGERRRLVHAALERERTMAQVPMTTLVTF